MSIKLEVTGIAELEKQLATFGKELGAKRFRAAMRESANLIRDEAISTVPQAKRPYWSRQKGGSYKKVSPGRLKRAIKVRMKVKDSTLWAFVGVRATGKFKDVFYQNFVEFGTRSHIKKNGSRHPGAEAQPFLRPAYKAKDKAFVDEFSKRLKKKIDALVKKRSKGLI